MSMKNLGGLIYTPESARGEAISKVESHTPKIDAPDTVKADQVFEIKATVGPHPNTIEHSIRRIEIYFYEEGRPFNPALLFSANLTPIFSEPNVSFKAKLSKSGTIYALEYCNLHGLWEGHREIRVTM